MLKILENYKGNISMGMYSINLNSGREIVLDELSQHHTYAGLIEGKPNVKMNKRIIDTNIKAARKKLWFDVEPVLISPIEKFMELGHYEIGGGRELYDSDRKTLPGIVCLSCWNCYEPARDEMRMGSVLKIVWFQDIFALPIDNSIVEQIKAVDWEKYAKDYDI